jgi:hypothetical protein
MEEAVLNIKGLYTSPNQQTLPSGAMLRCTNLAQYKPNTLSLRRGEKLTGSISEPSIEKLFQYQSSIISWANQRYYKDTLGNCSFTQISNTQYPPALGAIRPYSTSNAGNLYLTSSEGIQKIDTSFAIRPAGVPVAISGTIALSSTIPVVGVLAGTSTVAYRVTWSYKDASNNIVEGAPSGRMMLFNPNVTVSDVYLKIYLPEGVDSTSFALNIYRSLSTLSPNNFPTDELYLVDSIPLDLSLITQGFVEYTDRVLDASLGATLYTSPSRDGIEGVRLPPPIARDVATFNQMTVFANIQTRQRALVTLKKTGFSDGLFYANITGNTTSGSSIINLPSSITDLHEGMAISGTGIPANAIITSITSGFITINVNATATAVGVPLSCQDIIYVGSEKYYAGSTENLATNTFFCGSDIYQTITSFLFVLNLNSPSYYGYYIGINNSENGLFSIEDINISAPAFTINSSYPQAFATRLPLTSSNNRQQNAFMPSRVGEPDTTFLDLVYEVGSREFPILRVVEGVRGYVFFFKQDGIFYATGDSPDNLTVDKISDESLIGDETPASMDNSIYAYTDTGIIQVSPTGIAHISSAIDYELRILSKNNNSSFLNTSFGCAYHNEDFYILATKTNDSDTVATQAFVFCSKTGEFVNWQTNLNHMIAFSPSNRLYIAKENNVWIERKDYASSDHVLKEIDVVIIAYNGSNEFTLLGSPSVDVGDWFYINQELKEKIITVSGSTITLKNPVPYNVILGTNAKILGAITAQVQLAPVNAGKPALLKDFQKVGITVRDSLFKGISLYAWSDKEAGACCPVEVWVNTGVGFGLSCFGNYPFGGIFAQSKTIQTFMPFPASFGAWLNICFEISEPEVLFHIEGFNVGMEVVSDAI